MTTLAPFSFDMPALSRRAGGLAGLAFGAGVLVQNGFLLQGAPLPSATLDVVRDFYVERAGFIAVAVGWVSLNIPLLLVFASAVTLALSKDARSAVWARVAFGGVVLLCAAFTVTTFLQAVLTARADTLQAAGQLGLLWDLHSAAFTMSGLALAATLGSLSVAAWSTGFVARWVAAVGGVGAACLVGSGMLAVSTITGGPGIWLQLVGFACWVVWLLAASVKLLRAD